MGGKCGKDKSRVEKAERSATRLCHCITAVRAAEDCTASNSAEIERGESLTLGPMLGRVTAKALAERVAHRRDIRPRECRPGR